MVIGFGAIADLTGCPIDAIGQDIPDSFPPDKLFKKIVKPVGRFLREFRQLPVS